MPGRRRLAPYIAALVLAAMLYVWLTGRTLPPVIASHFGMSGAADAFMPRTRYLAFALTFLISAPLLLMALPGFLLSRRGARINVPNATYWLAPERRDASIAWLRQHLARFAVLPVALIAYVHWLVVRANAASPPALPTTLIVSGFVVFLLLAVGWVATLFVRFGRR